MAKGRIVTRRGRTIFVAAVMLLCGTIPLQAHAAARIQQVTSPSGISAWLAEDHERESFALHFIFHGSGRMLDGETRIGAASLLAQVLTAPLDEVDGQSLHDQFIAEGVEIRFSAEWRDFVGTVHGLSRSREGAFRLLGHLLAAREPSVDEGHRKRVKSDEAAMFEPLYLAAETWRRLVRSNGSAPQPIGAREDVFAVSPADLKRTMELGFVRDRLVIAVVGDITPAELAPLLDRAFSALAPHSAVGPGLNLPRATPVGIAVLERPLPQSFVIWSQTDPDFPSADRAAGRVVREIIGGQGNSRLYRGLRDAGGLAYFVQMAYEPGAGQPWLGLAATRNEVARKTVEQIRAEWDRLAREGASDREIELAKAELRDQHLLSLTSFEGYARQLVLDQVDGFETASMGLASIEAVAREDVARVVQRLDAEKLLFIIVGQPHGVEPVLTVLE
jgi:zinc protease